MKNRLFNEGPFKSALLNSSLLEGEELIVRLTYTRDHIKELSLLLSIKKESKKFIKLFCKY